MNARDDRVHVRMPSDLKSYAMDYARRNNITLSDLIVMLLTKLQRAEAARPDREEKSKG
jgi:antitoxin component of RelBE/YafQ-DinJ toxin-antitoxin module